MPSPSPPGPHRPGPPTGLLLAAVGTIVLLVSLPRMESYAAMDNASDARLAVRLVGKAAAERPAAVSTWSVLVGDEQLRHRLQDARPVGLGGLVRHHGYVLSRSGSGALIAWPEASRPNANPAYRWTPENGVEELQSSPWSGMPTEGAPLLPAPDEQAWQPSAVASETPR